MAGSWFAFRYCDAACSTFMDDMACTRHHSESCRARQRSATAAFVESLEPLKRTFDAFWLRMANHHPPKAPIRVWRGLRPTYVYGVGITRG